MSGIIRDAPRRVEHKVQPPKAGWDPALPQMLFVISSLHEDMFTQPLYQMASARMGISAYS